ncbi:MAG: hypothetical protein ACE5JM_07440 [Armatimonadota bacterium]
MEYAGVVGRWPRVMAVAMLAVLASAAATAQNVTVDADGTPLSQVLQRLEQEADVEFRAAGEGPPGLFARLVSYQAQDVPVGRAVREMCRTLGLDTRRYIAAGRRVFELRLMDPGEVYPPEVQAGPYLVRLTSVTESRSARLRFRGTTEPLTTSHGLRLRLVAEADTEEDAQALLAFDTALAATDDTGKRLESSGRKLRDSQLDGPPMPWSCRMSTLCSVAAPAKDAAALTSISGALIVAAKVTPLRFEFDATEQGASVTKEGYTVTLASLSASRTGVGQIELALARSPDRAATDREPFLRAYGAGRLVVPLSDGRALYLPANTVRPWRSDENKGRMTCGMPVLAPGVQPVKVVYSLFVRSQEIKTIPFRFETVPLPQLPE